MLLATDLDRTLFPNGAQQEENGLTKLSAVLASHPEIRFAFVSGRNLRMIEEGIATYHPPSPNFAIGMVGTKVYTCEKGIFAEDTGWVAHVRSQTKNWDIAAFMDSLRDLDRFRLQEPEVQNEFKLSYYLDDRTAAQELVFEVKERIGAICPEAEIVYSVDETRELGLLDILPRHATKMTALEYLRSKLGLTMDQVIYAGDSGNDILPITYGYKAILVRNAIDEVRTEITDIAIAKGTLPSIYFAQGTPDLSGYFASGIVEGLRYFGIS